MVFLNERLRTKNDWMLNATTHYLQNWEFNWSLAKSLLHQISNFKENGILPYSAYIFRSSNEQAMYLAALSVALGLKVDSLGHQQIFL